MQTGKIMAFSQFCIFKENSSFFFFYRGAVGAMVIIGENVIKFQLKLFAFI